MKDTLKELLENDIEKYKKGVEDGTALLKGLIILFAACIMILVIFASISYTEKKAMQSKIDSLKSSNQSLENNLLMPVEIRKFNDLNK